MKKLLLSLAAVVMTLGAFATTTKITWNTESLPQTWTATNEFTAQGFTFNVNKNSGSTNPTYITKGKDIRVYAKGTVQITASSNMTEIDFVISTAGLKRLASITSNVGVVTGLEDCTNKKQGDVIVKWTGSATTVTFTVGDEATFGTDGATKAGQFDFTTTSITTEDGGTSLPSAGLKFPQSSYTVELGETFDAPELTKATTAAVTYDSSNKEVATVDTNTGAVTIMAVGTTTITATTPETPEFQAGEAKYTLEVTAPVNKVDVTLAKGVSTGKYIIACEKGVAKNYDGTNQNFGYVYLDTKYVPANGNLICPEEYIFVITSTPKGFTIQGADEGKFYGMDATHKTSFNFYDSADATGSNCYWDITIDTDGNANITNKGRDGFYLAWKPFNSDFELVTTNSDTGKIQLYSNGTLSGVDDIVSDDANAPVEYYNLQGVRVANPESGLYIRVQGKKATKVLVK